MASVLRKAAGYSVKGDQVLLFAGDIVILRRKRRTVIGVFKEIKRESADRGLALNEGKTKRMFSTSRDMRHIVNEFVYLGSAVTSRNNGNLKVSPTGVTKASVGN